MPVDRYRATGVEVSPTKWWIAGGRTEYSRLDTSLIFGNGFFETGPQLKVGVAEHCSVAGETIGHYLLAFSLTETVQMNEIKKSPHVTQTIIVPLIFTGLNICISSSDTAANILHNSSMGFPFSAFFWVLSA